MRDIYDNVNPQLYPQSQRETSAYQLQQTVIQRSENNMLCFATIIRTRQCSQTCRLLG